MQAAYTETTKLREEYMIALEQVDNGGSDNEANSALHERIVGEEARLEKMLEAAIRKGAEGRGGRHAGTFRVSSARAEKKKRTGRKQ